MLRALGALGESREREARKRGNGNDGARELHENLQS
jgi:hypothetical protein